MAYIYIIGSTTGPLKIGFSKHPETRLKQLQTGCPTKLKIHYTEEVDSETGMIIEHLIHKENNYKRLSGEWFDLTLEEAISEIRFAIITYESEPSLKFLYKRKMI